MSQYADQLSFAAGVLTGIRTDLSGIQTPRNVGILQDVSLEFSADLKELYGQNRYAIALAPGKTKAGIKAKAARIDGGVFNDLYFGTTTTATQILNADGESGTIPGTSTYTVTVTNSTTFLTDLGVVYAATGQQLKAGATASAAGIYTYSAGVYTFHSGDASKAVYISYNYRSTSGIQLPIANIRMGAGPSFKTSFVTIFDGRQANYVFNQCQCSKLSMPAKQDDWLIYELDFMIAADSAGNIGTLNFAV